MPGESAPRTLSRQVAAAVAAILVPFVITGAIAVLTYPYGQNIPIAVDVLKYVISLSCGFSFLLRVGGSELVPVRFVYLPIMGWILILFDLALAGRLGAEWP
jgi:hypothetical protein